MPNDREYERKIESRAVWKLALYIFGVVLISMLLLGINAGMIFGLATAVEESLQNLPLIEPMTQYAIFVLPVLLLYLEWYVWDFLSSTRRRNRT